MVSCPFVVGTTVAQKTRARKREKSSMKALLPSLCASLFYSCSPSSSCPSQSASHRQGTASAHAEEDCWRSPTVWETSKFILMILHYPFHCKVRDQKGHMTRLLMIVFTFNSMTKLSNRNWKICLTEENPRKRSHSYSTEKKTTSPHDA